MNLHTIKHSLGSLVISCFLISCAGDAKVESNKSVSIPIDTCKADLTKGRSLVNKLSCTNCHFVWDEAPKMGKDIPLLKDISSMDSLKLSSYIFESRHSGMFSKDFPHAKKIIDSLSDCDKQNLIHYLKDHNREHVYASAGGN